MKADHIIAALAGTYSMINSTSFKNGTSTGTKGWGPSPIGLITYTRYGYMSVSMATTDAITKPEGINWPPKDDDSDADWAFVGRNHLSYAGKFSVNDTETSTARRGVLLHGPMAVASVPPMVGATQVRHYELFEQGGETYLMLAIVNGTSRGEVWWKRVVKG